MAAADCASAEADPAGAQDNQMAATPPPASPAMARNLGVARYKRERMKDDRPPFAIRIDLQGRARLGEVPVSIAQGDDIATTRRDRRAGDPADGTIAGVERAPGRA